MVKEERIKHEPAQEFVLILPPEREVQKVLPDRKKSQTLFVKLKKMDVHWKTKAKMYETCSTCIKCEFVTRREVNLLKHETNCRIKIARSSNLHQCDLCSFSSKSKADIRKHVLSHQKYKNYICNECEQEFKNKDRLQHHAKLMKVYNCDNCNEQFRCLYALRSHEKMLHVRSYKCDQCSYVTSAKSVLTYHKNIHNKKFSCMTCAKYFASSNNLKHHQMKHKHGIYAKVPELQFPCNECKNIYRTKYCLSAHKLAMHSHKTFQCDYCSSIFKNRIYLFQHIKKHVKASCHICKEKFQKNLLEKHLKEHFPRLKYQCDLCGRKLKNKGYINTHMKRIHPRGAHTCYLCHKRFEKINDFLQHKEIHIGGLLWKCLQCGHLTKSYYDLEEHIDMEHL